MLLDTAFGHPLPWPPLSTTGCSNAMPHIVQIHMRKRNAGNQSTNKQTQATNQRSETQATYSEICVLLVCLQGLAERNVFNSLFVDCLFWLGRGGLFVLFLGWIFVLCLQAFCFVWSCFCCLVLWLVVLVLLVGWLFVFCSV